MMVIYPYKLYGDTYYIDGVDKEDYPEFDIWVFDDPETGLHQEALLSGTNTVIDFVVKYYKINNPDQGFKLTFSNEPFEDYQLIGYWKEEGYSNVFLLLI